MPRKTKESVPCPRACGGEADGPRRLHSAERGLFESRGVTLPTAGELWICSDCGLLWVRRDGEDEKLGTVEQATYQLDRQNTV